MLTCLHIQTLRNITSLRFQPRQFNVIVGPNGSGKTSILEGIYLLGHGRSFRSSQSTHVIQENANELAVFAELTSAKSTIPVGIKRQRDGGRSIHIAAEKITLFAELAKLLPIQLINPDSFQLLNAGPKPRRQFLDWGVFHVEHSFWSVWRRYQQALRQRNAALKQRQSLQQIRVWDNDIIENALLIDDMRRRYLAELSSVYTGIRNIFLSLPVEIHYLSGWDSFGSIQEALQNALPRDVELGYTSVGPQRADVQFLLKNVPVEYILSRGQQKLLICTLLLAQGVLLDKLTGKGPLYLIDDLPSELDKNNCSRILDYLQGLASQLFITCINEKAIQPYLSANQTQMFHVEHLGG